MHGQHPVTGRHARCQFMESLLKDWFVHRGRLRLIRMGPDGCYMSNEMLDTLHHDLGINTEVTPGEAPWKLSITGVIMKLVKRTAHIFALDQGRETSCQACLLQAVMAHPRLVKHGGYTPLQLLFGHESAPIEREAFHDEQQKSQCYAIDGRETGKTAVSHQGVVANRSRISRRTNTEPTYTRCSTQSRCPSMGSLPTVRQAHGTVWIVVQDRLL